MIRYITLWHVLSKSLYIYTFGDTGIMEIDSATGGIYLENPGVDRHRLNIQNTHSIFPSSWSHALLPSFDGSTQFVCIVMARYTIISSHPLPKLLERDPLFRRNSLRMPCEVGQSVDNGLSAFQLQCVTTPCSTEVRDTLRGHDRGSSERHLEAVIMRTWRP